MDNWKWRVRRQAAIGVAMLLAVLLCAAPAPRAAAAAGPTVSTTLVDGAVQKGSKKTFDVWAQNAAGAKIASSVTLNGAAVPHNWDDTDKTSYTLTFTKEGANTVVVSATDGGQTATLTYTIPYQKAKDGDVIGQATWSVELFTIGCGYLVEPVRQNIVEGEASAQELLRLLHANGYVCYYGGTTQKSFYLAYVADGDKTANKYNGYINSRAAGVPASPKKLNLSPKIPDLLKPYLQDAMDYFDEDDYAKNWVGYIGEFAFTNGSGWMYSVNNVFPNVGFADTYLSDGDVVRVQFTLAYGADIGGASPKGGVDEKMPEGNFYPVVNKDRLTLLSAEVKASGKSGSGNVRQAYQSALAAMQTLNASDSQVDGAYAALQTAARQSAPPGATASSKSQSSPKTASTPSASVRPPSSASSDDASSLLSAPASSAGTTSRSSVPSGTGAASGKIGWFIAAGVIVAAGAAGFAIYWLKLKKKPEGSQDSDL